MGNSIGFFASNQDQLDLEDYARSIELHVIGLLIGQEVTPNPADGPGCFFPNIRWNNFILMVIHQY